MTERYQIERTVKLVPEYSCKNHVHYENALVVIVIDTSF